MSATTCTTMPSVRHRNLTTSRQGTTGSARSCRGLSTGLPRTRVSSSLELFLNNYSSAEIYWFNSELPLGIACLQQHVEQGLMSPRDFLQVRAISGIGKNKLPGGPGSHGPADPLEAQGGFRQGHPRRGHLEPASFEVVDKNQSPQTKRDTGQGHEAQDGHRRCTLVVAQPKMLLQVAE